MKFFFRCSNLYISYSFCPFFFPFAPFPTECSQPDPRNGVVCQGLLWGDAVLYTANFRTWLTFVNHNFSGFIITNFRKFGPTIKQNMYEKSFCEDYFSSLCAFKEIDENESLTKISSLTVYYSCIQSQMSASLTVVAEIFAHDLISHTSYFWLKLWNLAEHKNHAHIPVCDTGFALRKSTNTGLRSFYTYKHFCDYSIYLRRQQTGRTCWKW